MTTGQTVAVKRISLAGLKEEEVSQLMKEVDLLKTLTHPSIVKYEGMARTEDTLNIVLEYVLFTVGSQGIYANGPFQVRREWIPRTNSQGVREVE